MIPDSCPQCTAPKIKKVCEYCRTFNYSYEVIDWFNILEKIENKWKEKGKPANFNEVQDMARRVCGLDLT